MQPLAARDPVHRMVYKRSPARLDRRQITISNGGAGPTTTPAGGGNANGGQQNGGGQPNGGGQQNGGATPTTTDGGGGQGGVIGVISSVIDGGVARITSTAPAPTITQPASDTRAQTTVRPTSTVQPTVVQITQTSTFSASSSSLSATLAAASASTSAAPSSGGLKGGTLIAVIVVASVVAGLAGLWTLYRKMVLAPRRKFDKRLEPIDFNDPHADPHAGAGFVTRFPPASSASLVRADSTSTSSLNGGLKQPGHQQTMSEVSYSGSARGHYGYGAMEPPQMAAGQQPFAPPRAAGALHNPYATSAAGDVGGYEYDYGAATQGGANYARYS